MTEKSSFFKRHRKKLAAGVLAVGVATFNQFDSDTTDTDLKAVATHTEGVRPKGVPAENPYSAEALKPEYEKELDPKMKLIHHFYSDC